MRRERGSAARQWSTPAAPSAAARTRRGRRRRPTAQACAAQTLSHIRCDHTFIVIIDIWAGGELKESELRVYCLSCVSLRQVFKKNVQIYHFIYLVHVFLITTIWKCYRNRCEIVKLKTCGGRRRASGLDALGSRGDVCAGRAFVSRRRRCFSTTTCSVNQVRYGLSLYKSHYFDSL